MAGLATVEDFVRTIIRRGSAGDDPPSSLGLYIMLMEDLSEIEGRSRDGTPLTRGEQWLLTLARQEMPEGTA
jgi:hypothetical protein